MEAQLQKGLHYAGDVGRRRIGSGVLGWVDKSRPALDRGRDSFFCSDSNYIDRNFPDQQEVAERRAGYHLGRCRAPAACVEQAARSSQRTWFVGIPDFSFRAATPEVIRSTRRSMWRTHAAEQNRVLWGSASR